MKINIIQTTLSSKLKSLGQIIGKHPVYFIVIPCVVSCVLGTGLLKVEYSRDMEFLGVAKNGRALQSKRFISELFPENTSYHLDLSRTLEGPSGPIIYVLNKNGGNMINEEIFKELEAMDNLINKVSIKRDGKEITYKELCGRTNGKCFQNPVSKLIKISQDISSKRHRIKYPIEIDFLTFSYHPHIIYLGGVTTDDSGYVKEVKAIRFFYLTNTDNASNSVIRNEWEEAAIRALLDKKFRNITVWPFAFFNVFEEAVALTESASHLSAIVALVVVLFSIITCMSDSWVRSKPWLGIAAAISGVLSLLTAFGLMAYVGVKNTDANVCIAFLVLGTEIDDAYVLIAAWRATDPRQSVEKRLGITYQDAAVSVTVTSLTNILSLCIGLTAPFNVVKIFCAYAATAMCFTYIYQLCLFGACMALDGRREKRGLHPFTFRKITDEFKEVSGTESKAFQEERSMTLFKEKLGRALALNPVKALVIAVFFVNLFIGSFGIFHLQHGSEMTDTVDLNSPTAKHMQTYYKYFTAYPGTMQVIIHQTLNYADPNVQQSIEELLQNFTSHPNIADSSLVISWLKYYKMFMNHPISYFAMSGYDINDKDDFINGLREVFLRLRGAKQFEYDILFSDNGTDIISSRFLLVSKDVVDRASEEKFLLDMWRIADESSLSVTVHGPYFTLIEQALYIRDVTLQISWVTAILIAVVFFAFIPKVTSALFVSFTVLATIIETVGYMTLWGVRLEMGSMTALVLSIGLSVNYPSHASFAFLVSKEKEPNEKMKDCLYHVGLPIFQGSISTALGVSILALQKSYVCLMFLKIVVLVVMFTCFHAMFVLPSVLALYESLICKNGKKPPLQ